MFFKLIKALSPCYKSSVPSDHTTTRRHTLPLSQAHKAMLWDMDTNFKAAFYLKSVTCVFFCLLHTIEMLGTETETPPPPKASLLTEHSGTKQECLGIPRADRARLNLGFISDWARPLDKAWLIRGCQTRGHCRA